MKSRQGPRREPWGTPAVEKVGCDLNEEKYNLSQTGFSPELDDVIKWQE